ncbi:MAG: endonuclease V [Desulfurococcaceae archaeon]
MFNVDRAIKLQLRLSQIAFEETEKAPSLGLDNIRYIAGFDSSYSGNTQYAVAVVYDIENNVVCERAYAIAEVKVPYIPGLLAFREIPGYMRAFNKLRTPIDLVMVDGHGLSHPRAFGIASHLGLVLNKPSIGVAKKYLYGEIVKIGDRRFIKTRGKIVGEIINHENTELYLSIGFGIKLEDAVEIARKLLKPGIKLPVPIHEADKYSKQIKRKYVKN